MTEVLLGPPGCGKTTALLAVAREELQRGCPPDRLGFLSFTRRAAHEAVERAGGELQLGRRELPWFRTVHSLCFRALGLQRGDVLSRRHVKELADWAGLEMTGKASEDGTRDGYLPGDRALHVDNLARVRGVSLREQYDSDADEALAWSDLDRASKALREFKARRGLLDYTDMLEEFIKSGVSVTLDVLLVDEGQDLSPLQWAVVRRVAAGCRRVVTAGDDDQNLFEWAGADVGAFLGLAAGREPRVLGQSYRVPRLVQQVAQGVIGLVRGRLPKQWAPRPVAGAVDRVAEFGDAATDGQDVLVLARNSRYLDDEVEPALRRQGVVYERNGEPSIDRDVLAAVEAWESLRAGREVPLEEARLAYRYMSAGRGVERGKRDLRGLKDAKVATMASLKKHGGLLTDAIWHAALDRLPQDEMSYVLAARRRGESLRKRPRVQLSTVHRAKGGQASHVVLLAAMANRTEREMLEKDRDAEARVWYVAVTRAMERLTIVGRGGAGECQWL